MRKILSAMCMVPALLMAALGVFGSEVRAGGPAFPTKLTRDTFEAIKARVSLTQEDLAWQKVRWREGFFEGVMEAQAADKPLFFWFYGGGPTGNC